MSKDNLSEMSLVARSKLTVIAHLVDHVFRGHYNLCPCLQTFKKRGEKHWY